MKFHNYLFMKDFCLNIFKDLSNYLHYFQFASPAALYIHIYIYAVHLCSMAVQVAEVV